MHKLLLCLTLATSAVALAMPAQAARVPRCEVGSAYPERFDADLAEQRIRGLGLNVKSVPKVEEWNNCFRAYIQNSDGSESIMYFDPTTLQQVGGDYPR